MAYFQCSIPSLMVLRSISGIEEYSLGGEVGTFAFVSTEVGPTSGLRSALEASIQNQFEHDNEG